MTKIAPKKWLLVFIYSLGLIIFLIGSLNYYIDSSSFFSNNISSKYYFLDNNTFKTKYIIKNFKNKNIKKYLAIIKQIEKVRSKNNKNWMDLYRLAFAVAPNESVKIIKKILSRDKSVSKLAEKLTK